MGSRKKFLIYFCSLKDNEKSFISNLMSVICKYPIIWNNFLENIISKKYIVLSECNVVIHYPKIDEKLKRAVFVIYELLKKHRMISKEIVKQEFVIITLKSQIISELITDRNLWLKYYIAHILQESGKTYVKAKIKFTNGNILESDVVLETNNYLFLINKYDKYKEVKERIDKSRYIIPVFYKPKHVNTLIRSNIINYSFDYAAFKESLINLINRESFKII